jgi:hypothetical protein
MTTLSNTTVGALLIDVWTGTTNNLTLSQSNGGPAFNTNNFSGLVTTGYNLSRIMGIAAITSNVATSSTDVYTSFQTANISGLRTYSAINEAVAGNYYLNYQSAGGLQSRWAWSDSEIVDVTAVPGILYTPGFQGVGGALGSSNFVPVGQGLT